MRDPHNWMWAEACQMLERAERLQREFFRVGTSAAWQPPADVFETDRAVWVLVALPGVLPGHLSVAFDSGALIVAGERGLPLETRSAAIHRLEIPHGRFERRVKLPVGRYELERQELNHGLLIVGLRKI